jgi:hypothetical protein
MTQVKNRQRLKIKIRQLLIGGGLEGISQTTLIQKCRTYNSKANPNGFTGEDVRHILKDWKQRGLVQLFDIHKGYAKKPTHIWRATDEIISGRL